MDESDDPDAAARRLKATLRILSSPKSATRGGFRHRKSSVQEGGAVRRAGITLPDAGRFPPMPPCVAQSIAFGSMGNGRSHSGTEGRISCDSASPPMASSMGK